MRHYKFIIYACLLSLLSCNALGEKIRIDNVPMYGQPEVERPEKLKKADEEFIAKVSAAFGSRYKASQIWWQQGEKFRKEENFDYAMRRYNQSWLLDPSNYQPYWGFGLVYAHQGKIDEAITYLEKSEKLVNDNYQKAALLSDLGFAYTNKASSDPSYFDKADSSFEESTKLDPTYGNSWGNWAYSLYHQGNYKEAWDKVHKSREVNGPEFSTQFISNLRKEMPEPSRNVRLERNSSDIKTIDSSVSNLKGTYKSNGHETIPHPAPNNCMWIRDNRTKKYELDC